MALTNQDRAFLDAKKAQGVSFDEAWASLQKVKGGGTSAPQKTSLGSQFEAARSDPFAGPAIGAVKKATKTGLGLAAQAFEAAPGILGAGLKPATDKIAQGIREDMPALENETLPEKIGGTGLDIGVAALTGGAGRALGAGASEIGVVSKALPKILQKALPVLGEGTVGTAGFTESSEQRLPTPFELAAGVLGEGLVAVGGRYAPKILERLKQGSLTDNANRVYQKVASAGEESPFYKKYAEYLKSQAEHNTDKLAKPSAIRVFGNKIAEGIKAVKGKLQTEIGPKVGDALNAQVGAVDASNVLNTFEEYLSAIRVKPRMLRKTAEGVMDITDEAGDVIASDMAKTSIPDENQGLIDSLAKKLNQMKKVIPNFDSLDLPSALNAARKKAQTAGSATLDSFLDTFGRFDETVGDLFKQGEDSNDIYMKIKDRAFDTKGKRITPTKSVQEGEFETALTPKSFVGSNIELTDSDQAALIKTYNAIKSRKGPINKADLDALGTSIEGLVNYSKGSATQSLTQAEKPLADMARKIDEFVKKGMTEEQKAAYTMYSKGKRAERLLSKRLGDFGQGEFATGKSALGEQKFGLEVRQGLEDIKELTGVDLMEDLDVLSLVAEQIGDAQMQSLLNIVAMPRMGVGEAIATGAKAAYNYVLPQSQMMRAVLEAPELEDVPVGIIRRVLQAIATAGGAETADQLTQ